MPVTLNLIWGETERPWGYEIRADYRDETGRIFNESFSFPAAPSQAERDAAIESRRIQIEASLQPQYEIVNADGTVTRL